MVDPDILQKLGSQDWESIYPKLTHYAIWLTKPIRWRTPFGTLPKGLDPRDLASQAIERVFTGERQWHPNKHLDVLNYLKGVVRSLVSHLLRSPDHTRRQSSIAEGEELHDPMELATSAEPDPLDNLEAEELWDYLWRQTDGDEEMQLVLLCLDEDMKRGEIADQLELPPQKIDNIMKKIRRRTKKFLDSH
jgi:RNA polymerase sigma factor (sigma-70 family)